ncbi:Dethiobiotin synthetase [plant metagenome]|uniref:Dethiobiotin synthetase n=1 Tax=plant metagenome TaxID=1297885 RepID=A0A484RQQ2_9ZZZZ
MTRGTPLAITPRKQGIAARFGQAASAYERHASVQARVVDDIMRRLEALPWPAAPRILEIGCGSGLLSRRLLARWPEARLTLTDVSAEMVAHCRGSADWPAGTRHLQWDGEHPPADAGSYDLIVSTLAVQWFDDLNAGLGRLARLLAPGGLLAVATLGARSLAQWRACLRQAGAALPAPGYPLAHDLRPAAPALQGAVDVALLTEHPGDAHAFLRGLRGIGALSGVGLGAGTLRAAMRLYDQGNRQVHYEILYGLWRAAQARGVFVSGTDTGVGKTLASAILARAWRADYWKPMQTGLADEAGDTATVTALAALTPGRLHPPACALQAPLSPWDAAREEGITLDAEALALPATDAPLVVEGAGGLYVPIDGRHMMIDLAARLGLPVVLVARSTLGTINHTLLSLRALASHGVPVAGVVLSGPINAGNRHAIEHFGGVPVILEIPALDQVDARAVSELADKVPPLASLCQPPASAS